MPLAISQDQKYTYDASGAYGKPHVFGMKEPSVVQLFDDFRIDWAFLESV